MDYKRSTPDSEFSKQDQGVQSANIDDLKCKNFTLDELAILIKR